MTVSFSVQPSRPRIPPEFPAPSPYYTFAITSNLGSGGNYNPCNYEQHRFAGACSRPTAVSQWFRRTLDVPSTYPLRTLVTLDAQAVPFTDRQTVALPTPLCGPRNHFVGASIAVGNLNPWGLLGLYPVRQSDSGF